MDKNIIYKAAFETIKENSEWGIECEDRTYAYFVDGIVAMTDTLLKEVEKKESYDTTDAKITSDYYESATKVFC